MKIMRGGPPSGEVVQVPDPVDHPLVSGRHPLGQGPEGRGVLAHRVIVELEPRDAPAGGGAQHAIGVTRLAGEVMIPGRLVPKVGSEDRTYESRRLSGVPEPIVVEVVIDRAPPPREELAVARPLPIDPEGG
jgi:hypothetical protein